MVNVSVFHNTAKNNVLRVELFGLPTNYNATQSGAAMWCNFVDSTTSSAGYYYSTTPVTLPLGRFGGNIMSGPSNGRHLITTSAGHQGTLSVGDYYEMYLSSTNYDGEYFIPIEGGYPITVYGENISSSGAEFEANSSSFLGAPLRDINEIYLDSINIIPGHSSTAIAGNHEIVIQDSANYKGLLCTEGAYSEDPFKPIATGDLDFYAITPSNAIDSVPTMAKLNGYIKIWLIPFVSIRCNLVGYSTTETGDWYTPSSGDDLYCRLRTDRVPPGGYSVEIQAMGYNMVSVVTLSNVIFVASSPSIDAVSSRYVVDNVPVKVFGSDFVDNGAMSCRYTRTFAHNASQVITYTVPGVYVSDSEYDCPVPALSVEPGTYLNLDVSIYSSVGCDKCGSWMSVTRKPLQASNVIYDNFDWNVDERPFIYMGNYTSHTFTQTSEPIPIWTFGHHEYNFTSNVVAASGVKYISQQEPMYCFFESSDGNVTIVKPSLYSLYNSSGAAELRCRVPPSPQLRSQETWLSIGYWLDFKYNVDVRFQYVPFDLMKTKMTMIQSPSKITNNTVPLSQQPRVLLTDLNEDIIMGVNVTITVTVNPAPIALYGYTTNVDKDTGFANFAVLQIVGRLNEEYELCFTSSTSEVVSSEPLCNYFVYRANCSDSDPFSVERDGACVCIEGYQSSINGYCEACPINTYKSSFMTQCMSCPNGKITLDTGASSSDQCVCNEGSVLIGDQCLCAIGYYLGASGVCVTCDVGAYKNVTGNGNCTKCSSMMTTNNNGSTSFSACHCISSTSMTYIVPINEAPRCVCSAGHQYINQTLCQPCPYGTYKPSAGDAQCLVCQNGTTDSGSTSCSCSYNMALNSTSVCVCKAGYALNNGVCQPCPYGTYKPLLGDSLCISCSGGMNTTNTGSTSGSDCNCPSDMQLDYTTSQCVCKAGYAPNNGVCMECPHGTYKQIIGNYTCSSCGDMMTTTDTNSTSENACVCLVPTTMKYDSNTKSCKCDRGYEYISYGVCQPCSNTTYKNEISNGQCVLLSNSCGEFPSLGYLRHSAGCLSGMLNDSCVMSCAYGFVNTSAITAARCTTDGIQGAHWTALGTCVAGPTLSMVITTDYINNTNISPIKMTVKFNRPSEIVLTYITTTNCVISNNDSLIGVYDYEFELLVTPNVPSSRYNMSLVVTFGPGAGHSSDLSTLSTQTFSFLFDYCTYSNMTYDCAGVCGGSSVMDKKCKRCVGGNTGRKAGDCESANSATDEASALDSMVDTPTKVAATSGTALLVVAGAVLCVMFSKKKRNVTASDKSESGDVQRDTESFSETLASTAVGESMLPQSQGSDAVTMDEFMPVVIVENSLLPQNSYGESLESCDEQ